MNVNIFAVRDNIDAFHTIRSLEKKNIKAKAFPIVKFDFVIRLLSISNLYYYHLSS